jgi:3-oxoacyl-[acyl-carrier protein] reductase
MVRGKILLVGGNGFLGRDLVPRLEELGYSCIIPSRTDKQEENFLDLTIRDSIESFCSGLQNIEGVIFLSGKEPQQNLHDLSWEHLSEMISVHFSGVLWCIKNLTQKINPGGFCLFTSSVASKRGSYDPTYASLKSAVEGLTRTLARDLSPRIRVNCISPGLVEKSPVFDRMSDSFREKHLETTPLKRFCTTYDISSAYLFAIENKGLTGQILQINGGQVFG